MALEEGADVGNEDAEELFQVKWYPQHRSHRVLLSLSVSSCRWLLQRISTLMTHLHWRRYASSSK